MKNIRTMIASLLLMIGSTAMADSYQYLTIAQSGGETSFTVNNIQKITFDTTNMILQLKDGTSQSLPLSGLQKMFFANGTNAIANMNEAKSTIQFKGGMLHADIAAGEKLTVYNMKGEQVLSANQSGTYDLTTFVKGVYIVKVGTEAKKVVNK
ncbi:MAG: T9SS type A sorting domain-containing protein [Prevotella sp.]|nr:T9SS type A sorting domain-containing protein [Prevotella sp.]